MPTCPTIIILSHFHLVLNRSGWALHQWRGQIHETSTAYELRLSAISWQKHAIHTNNFLWVLKHPPKKKGCKPPTKSRESIGPTKLQKSCKDNPLRSIEIVMTQQRWTQELESLYAIAPWSIINLQNATPNGAYNCSRNAILNGSSWVNFRSPSPACGLWAQHLALEEVKDILGRIFCVTAACQLSYSPWPWACWTCPLQTPAWIGFVTWSKCVKRYLAKQEAAINRSIGSQTHL